jgi:hypothetical protein
VATSSDSTNVRTSSAPSDHLIVIIRDSRKRGSALRWWHHRAALPVPSQHRTKAEMSWDNLR